MEGVTYFYKRNDILGSGAFGIVVCAVNKEGEKYALKFFSGNAGQGEIHVQRRLSHPNIINCIALSVSIDD